MDKPYILPGEPGKALFPLGALVITSAAGDALPRVDIAHAIRRHAAGFWGDLSDEDRAANATALQHGGRILSSHSPDGFEWGYGGSGPAQLALALLADCLDNEQEAVEWHQDFKSAVVAGLPREGWTLTEEEIRDTITAFENE